MDYTDHDPPPQRHAKRLENAYDDLIAERQRNAQASAPVVIDFDLSEQDVRNLLDGIKDGDWDGISTLIAGIAAQKGPMAAFKAVMEVAPYLRPMLQRQTIEGNVTVTLQSLILASMQPTAALPDHEGVIEG